MPCTTQLEPIAATVTVLLWVEEDDRGVVAVVLEDHRDGWTREGRGMYDDFSQITAADACFVNFLTDSVSVCLPVTFTFIYHQVPVNNTKRYLMTFIKILEISVNKLSSNSIVCPSLYFI